ncbi:hypothetical protein DUT91_15565 [Phyllobacterium salinisoli]|uniref:Exopolysaccharide production protein YjbE n=1 Tax=Phyllobacterium salinisoli TaxID=1899321 RepID=A0A368K0J0_9HYPH|nr:hypothetical protein [Phyllobacterium salinisoli]RCS22899.1 hypothetical protein DUT91_15565 [Phyllobacterium salinisoli]
MKLMSQLMAASMIILLSGGFAAAECVDTTTSAPSRDTQTAGIAKDGSKAPLEDPTGHAAHPGPDAVKKDGQTMPLADQQGGGNKDLAASQQDVEAQQKGEKTAAAEAKSGKEGCAQ